MHPWHDVALGSGVPEIFPVIVEVPMGSKNKYVLDKATGLIRVDRVLFSVSGCVNMLVRLSNMP